MVWIYPDSVSDHASRWLFLLPAHPSNVFLQQSKYVGLNQIYECCPPSGWMSDLLLVLERDPLPPRLGDHAMLHFHLLHISCPGTLFMPITSKSYTGPIAATYELFHPGVSCFHETSWVHVFHPFLGLFFHRRCCLCPPFLRVPWYSCHKEADISNRNCGNNPDGSFCVL